MTEGTALSCPSGPSAPPEQKRAHEPLSDFCATPRSPRLLPERRCRGCQTLKDGSSHNLLCERSSRRNWTFDRPQPQPRRNHFLQNWSSYRYHLCFILNFLRPVPKIILSTLLISPTPCAQVQNKRSSFVAVSLETFCKQTVSILHIYLNLFFP